MSHERSAGAAAIIFDLDGTLIDSAPDIAAAVNRVLADAGQAPLEVDYVEGFIGDGSRAMLKRIFADQGIDQDSVSLERRLADYMRYYAEEPATRTEIFGQVRADLASLQAAGLKLGICTNKPHRLTELVLAALDLQPFFSCVMGADVVPNRKPHRDHLLAVAAGLGTKPEETWYVGDTEVDRACAHAAGIRFFLVDWGGGRFLEDAGDTRISSFLDLLSYPTPQAARPS